MDGNEIQNLERLLVIHKSLSSSVETYQALLSRPELSDHNKSLYIALGRAILATQILAHKTAVKLPQFT